MRHFPERARRALSLVFLVPAALAALLLSSCSSGEPKGSEAATEQHAPPPPGVVVKAVARQDLPFSLEYMGQTAGSRQVEVRARVGGILLRRAYVEGRQVRQGDLMFEIDPEPFQTALDQAGASLAQTRARQNQAKRDLERMSALFKDDVVSQKDRDDALTAFETASAEVQAAEAKVREARINLGYTRVEAPISGMTSKETRSEGSLVTTSADGSLLTTINRLDPLYVNFSMPGPDHTRFRKLRAEGRLTFVSGDDFTVRLILPDGTPYGHAGRINFTDAQVDTQTGVVHFRAEFENPDAEVLPGQFVRVHLGGARLHDVLAVPQGAVLRTQQGPMVWVVDAADTVQPRPVTLGEQFGNDYLVEDGLQGGERVITEGVIKVRPGITVAPTQENATAPANATSPATQG